MQTRIETRELDGQYYVDVYIDGVRFSARAESVELAVRLVERTARAFRLAGFDA